jgi:hypothetical protein
MKAVEDRAAEVTRGQALSAWAIGMSEEDPRKAIEPVREREGAAHGLQEPVAGVGREGHPGGRELERGPRDA